LAWIFLVFGLANTLIEVKITNFRNNTWLSRCSVVVVVCVGGGVITDGSVICVGFSGGGDRWRLVMSVILVLAAAVMVAVFDMFGVGSCSSGCGVVGGVGVGGGVGGGVDGIRR
jgi:hypothetical protein